MKSWLFVCWLLTPIMHILRHCMDLPNSSGGLCREEVLVKDEDDDEKACLCI